MEMWTPAVAHADPYTVGHCSQIDPTPPLVNQMCTRIGYKDMAGDWCDTQGVTAVSCASVLGGRR